MPSTTTPSTPIITTDEEHQNLIKCIKNNSIYIGTITIIDSIITILLTLFIYKWITSPYGWKMICIILIILKLLLSYFIHQIISHFQIDIKEEFI